jgi:ubiquinone/menaquinone biosynthesis C-methylase UbiE
MQTWTSSDAAERWRQGTERRAQALGPATERLLDAARLEPGMRVLDIAAGTGDTSLLAARRVGPTGSVLAVDISPSMLEVAAESARAAGLANLDTLVQDVSMLDLPAKSFDAVISRLGLMFLDDLEGGLRAIRGALKPGCHMAALVWSTAERNPYLGTPIEIVRAAGLLASESVTVVRAFSLGAPGGFESALVAAGFVEVSVERLPIVRAFASVDEAMNQLFTTTSAMTDLYQDVAEANRERLTRQIAQRFADFCQLDGRVVMHGELLLGSGAQRSECYDQPQ